jgi:hypothetical protein
MIFSNLPPLLGNKPIGEVCKKLTTNPKIELKFYLKQFFYAFALKNITNRLRMQSNSFFRKRVHYEFIFKITFVALKSLK